MQTRPGPRHDLEPRSRTPSAASSAIASRLASNTSTLPARQTSGDRRHRALPRRGARAVAAILWSCSAWPLKNLTDLEHATIAGAAIGVALAAATRPGRRLGRMSERSAAIGLASASPRDRRRTIPLPLWGQTTMSPPRETSAASVRLAMRVRFCRSVSTGFRQRASSRGRGAGATRSTPAMRRICSTRSALTWMSGRQVGRVSRSDRRAGRRDTSKPSFSRMPRLLRGISSPRRATSLHGKTIVACVVEVARHDMLRRLAAADDRARDPSRDRGRERRSRDRRRARSDSARRW